MEASPNQYDRLGRFTASLRKLADTGADIESVDDHLLYVVLPGHIRHVEGFEPGEPGAFRLVSS